MKTVFQIIGMIVVAALALIGLAVVVFLMWNPGVKYL